MHELIGKTFEVRREGYVWTLEILEQFDDGYFLAESGMGTCYRELSEAEAREAVRNGCL